MEDILKALDVSVNAGAAGVVGVGLGLLRSFTGLGKKGKSPEAKAKKRQVTVLLAMVLGVAAVWLMNEPGNALTLQGMLKQGIGTGAMAAGLAGVTKGVAGR